MTPASGFVAFIFLAVAASLRVPGCLPDQDATIVSQSIFQVPDLTAPASTQKTFTNLILTYFTCPSREVQADPTGSPIDLCGIMDSSAVFQSTFNCDQSGAAVPKIGDCGIIDDAVTDSLIRPMTVTIPAGSGLVVSLVNNTCAFVFLNDDVHDMYETCFHSITDLVADLEDGVACPQIRDGFNGSVRSLIQPGVQNWEVHLVSSTSLDLDN